jgi:hypothetical protein
MPSSAVRRRTSLLTFSLALAAPLGAPLGAPLAAQAPVHGTDINAASDSGRQRSPILFGSAYTAPVGTRGVSLQQAASLEHDRVALLDSATSYHRRAFASTLSAYWGVRPWLTVGGSLGFSSTQNEISRSSGTNASQPGQWVSYPTSSIGDLRAFGRARLYRSASGAMQVTANAAIAASPSSSSGSRPALTTIVGLALAQRVGPLSLHLAPTIETGNGGAFAQVGGAIVFPIMPHVSGSFEGVASGARPASWGTPSLDPMFELGGGLRFDFGRLRMDLGHRQVTLPNASKWDPQRMRFVLGTHVTF